MDDGNVNKEGPEPGTAGPKKLGGFLASALDLEEQVSNSVYRDYLQRENWPDEFDPQVFETIQKHLVYLIEDTQKHIKWIMDLTRKYAD